MVDEELEALKHEFLKESVAKVTEIRNRLREYGSGTSDDSLEEMINLAHQLKGAGGSYGYQTISTEAAALEEQLESIKSGVSPGLRDAIAARLDRLDTVMSERSSDLGTTPNR